MDSPFFPDVEPIRFGGEATEEPLAYRYYDPDLDVMGRKLAEQLRMSVCFWHTFGATGADPFGAPTIHRSWNTGDPLAAGRAKIRAAFEFIEKLGVPYFCFHDRDVSPEAATAAETQARFETLLEDVEREMERTGARLLWGTANLFSHPRYACGAATNPDPEVFAYAAWQVKNALEATQRLGGENYVLWGGREGYETLLNTDLHRESEQFARFLHLVAEHKARVGFEGTLLIEPKPHEPTKHQYDRDVETVLGFLERHRLAGEYKLNVEVNHATLAGHSFHHEIAMATAAGAFGSIDANRGDPQLGWDTDQFPNDAGEMALAMYEIIRAGGFGTGGVNFDARVRRASVDPIDLFHGHVGAIDTVARAFRVAAALHEDGALERFVDQRYRDWTGDLGRGILVGASSLQTLAERVEAGGIDPAPRSGRQEFLENLVNRAL